MINEINIYQMFPKFILEDKDGYALCRALEAGLNYYLEKCQEGIDNVLDVDKMPEWRLDEMAWELNCLYDYEADIDIKREWIKNAYRHYRIHGTAEGIRQYLAIYFGDSWIEEYWEFDGDPGQFNVMVTGQQSEENEAWVRKACAKAKNIRSELNSIVFNGGQLDPDTIYNRTAVTGIEEQAWVQMVNKARDYTVADIQDMLVGTLQKLDVRIIQEG